MIMAELARWLPTSLIRYGMVGLFTNTLLYMLFLVLIRLELSAVLSASVCYVFGITLSYLLNRRWSFESAAPHRQDLPRFLLSYGVGFGATIIFITVLTRWLAPEIAQILNIALTAITIYLSLRLFRFGQVGERNAR